MLFLNRNSSKPFSVIVAQPRLLSSSATLSLLFPLPSSQIARFPSPQLLPRRTNSLSSRPFRMPSYRSSLNTLIRSPRHRVPLRTFERVFRAFPREGEGMGRRESEVEGESKGFGRAIGGCRALMESDEVLSRRLPCARSLNNYRRTDSSTSSTFDHRFSHFTQRFPLFITRDPHSIVYRIASYVSTSRRRTQYDEKCDRWNENANGGFDENCTSPYYSARRGQWERSSGLSWRSGRRNDETRIQNSTIRFRLE